MERRREAVVWNTSAGLVASVKAGLHEPRLISCHGDVTVASASLPAVSTFAFVSEGVAGPAWASVQEVRGYR